MIVYVLTGSELKKTRPFGVVASEVQAQTWALQENGNDYFPFELDFGTDVPAFPAPPSLNGLDLDEATQRLSAYIVEVRAVWERLLFFGQNFVKTLLSSTS